MNQVRPQYPDEAKARYEQGTVKLRAVINREGNVVDLRLVEGTCALAKASIEAVRQWRYAPTLLNGEPVEVDTFIEVVFELHR